jgi:hypothetical protein
VKKYGKYRRNCEMIWTIWKKIVKRHGDYGTIQLTFLLYFSYLFTIQLAFLPYCPYLITIRLAFLPYFPYLFTVQLTFLLYFPNLFTGNYGRKVSGIVKRFGKYRKK